MTLAEQVRDGLTNARQKSLPAVALYDDVGSALFDAITAMPEYGLTRADVRLLFGCAHEVAKLTGARRVVELGSGNGTKTRILLSAMGENVVYCPVDVSRAALERCVAELATWTVEPFEGEFLAGLRASMREGPALVAFLGSNIGNFDRADIPSFFKRIRQELRGGDSFLLGADLVKPVEQLLLAYDDPAGVTAAFNRNLLSRLNREFDGDFDPRCFEHEARWNAEQRRIEMHLRSTVRRSYTLRGLALEVAFETGETIWTESSHKFDVEELEKLAVRSGFRLQRHWTDAEWPFAELLFRAAEQ